MTRMLRIACFCGVAFSFCLLATAVTAQQWPQRPVRIVVPYAPGGNTDAIARLTAERLANAFGQSFIVENRAGAGGAIAADYVAKQPADGYTLFVAALSQFGPVPLTQKVSYDPLKDFTAISNIGANGFVIAISSTVPADSVKEFVDYVKARPARLNYGSGGSGSLTHLAAALLLHRAGISMTHVPYKGGAPALIDTIGGQVQMYAGSPSELIPHTKNAKLKLIGITSERRNAQLPEVPTIAETYPGFKALTWNGLVAPANLPRQMVSRLADEMQRALKDPAFLERLAKLGLDPVPTTPSQFAADIKAEYAMWRDLIKATGITVE